MKTLNDYIKKDMGYVSKWWKWALLIWIGIEVIIGAFLIHISYVPEVQLDGMKEIYFDFGKNIYFMGYFNEE